MRNLFLAIFVPCLPLSFQFDCEILHTRLSTVQVCYVQLNLSMLDVFDNCLCCNIKVLVLDSVQVCFSDRSLTTQDARDCPHPGWSVRQPDRSQVLGDHLRRARHRPQWSLHRHLRAPDGKDRGDNCQLKDNSLHLWK